MGDRVLFQVIGGEEYSPVIYGHWAGERAPQVCASLRERMRNRPGDVSYTAARLVQELIGLDNGALSYGIWNADAPLVAGDSHGDAGVVLIHVAENGRSPMRFECLGGYLVASPDGESVSVKP